MYRLIDKPGAVVSGHDLYPCRKRGRDLLELRFNTVDYVEGIEAVTHDDNAANGFALSLPVGRAAALVGSKRDCAQIAHQHGRAILGCDRNIFEIGEGAQIAEAADHVLGSAHLQHVSADFVRTLTDFFDHRGGGDAIRVELLGIEVDLILAYESANAGHLCYAGNSLELIAQIPVLQRAQIGHAFGMAAIDESIFVDPACAGGVGANGGMHIGGQASGDLLQILCYAGTRPVEVGVILKDDEDIRVAEHGLGAHILDVRSGEQSGDDRVGDLVFDHIRRFAGP